MLDLNSMWNFRDPAASEARFRAALATANGNDALILQTQIARTYGLRRDFVSAQRVLSEIEPSLGGASGEVQTRHALELGRTYASAVSTKDELTPDNVARARAAYARAMALAQAHRLDGLYIDAIHMMAFVDTAFEDQLRWSRKGLEVALASSQPEAARWQASLRNNIGYALFELKRYEDALTEFSAAIPLREKLGHAENTRFAHWQVARTLRLLKRTDEALDIQLRLERENDAGNSPDPDVYEELELLYRDKGDAVRAAHYARMRAAVSAQP